MTLNSISKYISCLKQGSLRNSIYVIVDFTYSNLELTKLLFKHGFITHYTLLNRNYGKNLNLLKKVIVIFFKYNGYINVIQNIKQISKPGRRIYIDKQKLLYTYGKNSFYILSTSHGFYTIHELRQLGIGGELLIEINC